MTLDELLALLPDNTTGAIDAADLRIIVTELFAMADSYGQVFSYRFNASASNPATWGQIAVDPPWSDNTALFRISKTADDGQAVSFALIAAAPHARFVLTSADGSVLRADLAGTAIDNGDNVDIPVAVTGRTGNSPLNGEQMNLAVVVGAV